MLKYKVTFFYWNPYIFVGSPYKSLYFECYATMPMLADALISSLGYLRKHYSHNCREGVSSRKVILYFIRVRECRHHFAPNLWPVRKLFRPPCHDRLQDRKKFLPDFGAGERWLSPHDQWIKGKQFPHCLLDFFFNRLQTLINPKPIMELHAF